MKSKNENFDDVVFEERNKNYGAYFLRRSYNKNVARALFLSTLFFLGVISIPLIAGLMHKGRNLALEGDSVIFEGLPKPPVYQEPIELPKPPPLIASIPSFNIRIVDSTEIEDPTSLIDIMDGVKNETPADITDGGDLIVDETKKPDLFDPPIEEPYIDVPERPEFIGGMDKMYEYLAKTIDYPRVAVDNGIEGKVHVKFVVEKDGSISNITLLNDIGGGCGDEALRVVKTMPTWKAGKQNGTPVRVWFVLPINFILEN
jgi:periplasmic protein TonB